jgi:phosphoglycerate dehydrogenase-like enzyme
MIPTAAFPSARNDGVRADLQRQVAGIFQIVADDERCEVLIDGRPDESRMSNDSLTHIIVPFAGVPAATLRLAKTHPHVSLHNLHHNAPETAEIALALMFAAAKRVVPADVAMRRHDWSIRYQPDETLRLAGRTAVILGFGEIGRRIGAACRGLGMRVRGVTRSGAPQADWDVVPISQLDTLLADADVLFVALPQTIETEALIGEREIAMLKRHSIIVNVARAQIIDERALYEALASKRIHSAGLDVWYSYPSASSVPNYFSMPESASNTPPSQFPFHELDNVVMSPHRGGASRHSEIARVEHLATLLRAIASGGEVPNRVDLDRGY